MEGDRERGGGRGRREGDKIIRGGGGGGGREIEGEKENEEEGDRGRELKD